jgi:hypothetical protein
MNFLLLNGVEPERVRLSQSAAYEPLTSRLESAWQDENNCVEVFLLTEVAERVPGTRHSHGPESNHAAVIEANPGADVN